MHALIAVFTARIIPTVRQAIAERTDIWDKKLTARTCRGGSLAMWHHLTGYDSQWDRAADSNNRVCRQRRARSSVRAVLFNAIVPPPALCYVKQHCPCPRAHWAYSL